MILCPSYFQSPAPSNRSWFHSCLVPVHTSERGPLPPFYKNPDSFLYFLIRSCLPLLCSVAWLLLPLPNHTPFSSFFPIGISIRENFASALGAVSAFELSLKYLPCAEDKCSDEAWLVQTDNRPSPNQPSSEVFLKGLENSARICSLAECCIEIG